MAMRKASDGRPGRRVPVYLGLVAAAIAAALIGFSVPVFATSSPVQPEPTMAAAATMPVHHTPGGEVNLKLPSLAQGDFFGLNGHQLLESGLVVCVLGLLFGWATYRRVKKLPVHRSMAEISELIYETCKAYLLKQGQFLLVLELFIGAVIVAYFAMIGLEAYKIVIILLFSLIGIGGSYGVAWFGIRINTLANSRTAFASLRGKPFPVHEIPAARRHERGHDAHQRRAADDAAHPALHSGRSRRGLLHRFRDR